MKIWRETSILCQNYLYRIFLCAVPTIAARAVADGFWEQVVAILAPWELALLRKVFQHKIFNDLKFNNC